MAQKEDACSWSTTYYQWMTFIVLLIRSFVLGGWREPKKKACLLSSFEDKFPCLIRHLQPDWTRFWKTFFVNIRGECNLQSRISPPFSSGQSGRFKDRIKGECIQTNSSWTLPLTRISSTGHWPIGFDEQLVLF